MITREEYNKALDIVEDYHKQLLLGGFINNLKAVSKTRLYEWNKLHLCSSRLRSILKNTDEAENIYHHEILYIEDLTRKDFIKYRNAGQVSWTEFINLRGY
jgi:hypothetical protein